MVRPSLATDTTCSLKDSTPFGEPIKLAPWLENQVVSLLKGL